MIFTQGPKFRMSLILLFEEREGERKGGGRERRRISARWKLCINNTTHYNCSKGWGTKCKNYSAKT